MEEGKKAIGIIINPCYRRPAVLRALIDGLRDSNEEEDQRSGEVIYLKNDPDISSISRGEIAAKGGY